MEFESNINEQLTPLDDKDARVIAQEISKILDSKKAFDIKVIHVEEKTVLAEYFVLCTGNSSTQIKALAAEVDYRMEQRGIKPYNIEGRDNNSWILLDYSNVIVHVFSREARDFYNLDRLYED